MQDLHNVSAPIEVSKRKEYIFLQKKSTSLDPGAPTTFGYDARFVLRLRLASFCFYVAGTLIHTGFITLAGPFVKS